MRRRHQARAPWILAAAPLLAAVSCAGSAAPVQQFTVDPGSGMPASRIVLTGFTVDTAHRDGVVVEIGDKPTFFSYLDDGTIVALVPMYMDTSTWPKVPSKPQPLKVYRKGVLVATSTHPFQVLPLAEAPGTTQQIATNIDAIAAGFDGITSHFPPPDANGVDINKAISELLHAAGSSGENSMQAFADGTAPLLAGKTVNMDLVDAVLASSGILARTKGVADALAAFRAQPVLPSPVCDFSQNDYELACLMQFQVWFKRIMQDYVGKAIDKAEPYFKWVGLVAIEVPEAAIPVALAEVIDILDVKIAPTMYPSKFKSLQVVLTNPTPVPYDWTKALFQVTAVDEPASLGIDDLLKFALAALELVVPEGEAAESLAQDATMQQQLLAAELAEAKKIITGVVKWIFTQLDMSISSTVWDKVKLSVPTIIYGPVQIQPASVGLLELTEADKTVVKSIAATSGVLDWRALKPGTTTVQALPRGPDTAIQLFQPLFAAEKVGAFGHATSGSNQPTVVVPWGNVDYTIGNHGQHGADGTATPTPGGGSDGTAMQPNEVDASMWDTRWSISSKSPDQSWLWIVCNTPFSQLGAPIMFDVNTNPACGMTWYDDPANPNVGGNALTGNFSFDTCTVIGNDGTRPTAVLFAGSYGATFSVVAGLQGGQPTQEQDSFSGTFNAVFTLDDTVSAGSPNVGAIEAQCDGWPPSP